MNLNYKNTNIEKYKLNWENSISDKNNFWSEQAQRIHWRSPFTKVQNCSFLSPVHIEWFTGGKLNVSENCIDKHLPHKANDIAYYWESDAPTEPTRQITYQELHDEVCKLSNALKSLGVKKGDRVTIYLPLIPEAIYSMLACTRIGAIHSVIFAGFSPESIISRLEDSKSKIIITANESLRAGKIIPLKKNVDEALQKVSFVEKVLVFNRTNQTMNLNSTRDLDYKKLVSEQKPECVPEIMDSEDPLFILYTSGSTGKPKGVLHTTAGYLLYASFTHEIIFDYKPGQVYWCTADVGWITGHSYVVYGPLMNGATSLIFEGVPTFPTASRHWELIDKYKVNIYYTAPTAIRSLMALGTTHLKNSNRDSLKILGSVGEPINPEAWNWFFENVGNKKCPIVDTWWQTETGGICISPIPGITNLEPGSATQPFFGIEPVLMNSEGQEIKNSGEGILCIKNSWPGQARTLWGDHSLFEKVYFSSFKGFYFTGDACKRDEKGNYWISGRVDDVINVSGHRLGTAEIESALVAHPKVSEAAVVGIPHEIKGQAIFAYVSLNQNEHMTESLNKELIQWVRKQISPIASPEILLWAPQLPKTRSGKIMRRILRKIAVNEFENLGDISTLADPACVEKIIEERKKI